MAGAQCRNPVTTVSLGPRPARSRAGIKANLWRAVTGTHMESGATARSSIFSPGCKMLLFTTQLAGVFSCHSLMSLCFLRKRRAGLDADGSGHLSRDSSAHPHLPPLPSHTLSPALLLFSRSFNPREPIHSQLPPCPAGPLLPLPNDSPSSSQGRAGLPDPLPGSICCRCLLRMVSSP